MLPAFASIEDFIDRVPGGVGNDDMKRALGALNDASTLIRAEARRNYVDEHGALALPTGVDSWRADILARVCVSAALRRFLNPDGMSEEHLGGYGGTMANASPDVYLTSSERRDVRRAAGTSGIGTISTTRSDLGPDGRPFGLEVSDRDMVRPDRDVDPGALVDVDDGEPVPWFGPDGY